MKLLPIALDVENKLCLVVGGGAVAARKASSLLECGARVKIVSLSFDEKTQELLSQVEWEQRAFEPDDCDGCELVFACTDNRETNGAIAREAVQRNIWCNVADASEESTFHLAAAVRRGEICIGINTAGASPALARHLRERIEECVGEEYSALLELLGARRERLKVNIPEQRDRADLWRQVVESDVLNLLRLGQHQQAERAIDQLLTTEP